MGYWGDLKDEDEGMSPATNTAAPRRATRAPLAEPADFRNARGSEPRPLTDAELGELAWFGAGVYSRGRLIGFTPVRWMTFAEHLADLVDLDQLCTFRHFRFSGSVWEVVTQRPRCEHCDGHHHGAACPVTYP